MKVVHRPHLPRGPQVVISYLTLAVAILVMGLPTLGYWLDSRAAERQTERLIDQNDELIAQRDVMAAELDEVLRQQDVAQQLSACRSGFNRAVNLAMVNFLRSTLEPGDATKIKTDLDRASEIAQQTEALCTALVPGAPNITTPTTLPGG